MSRDVREAILRGTAGAAETHEAFDLRERHQDGLNPIDVFGLINELDIPLHFTPLDNLLGACVRVDDVTVGILVTTQRDLHMQRFTAAHELGHFILEHEGSLDREVRMPGHTDGRDLLEVEADAFAAEFLMPKWLVSTTAKRRAWWTGEALTDPLIVYQLSLRLASSFEATCWGLASHSFLTRKAASSLVATTPKEVKGRILQGIPLKNPWADVWLLGPGDNGAMLHASADDIFVFELEERAATGFRWDPREVLDEGFELLLDNNAFSKSVVGGGSRRRLVFRAPPAGIYNFNLPLRRSFSPTLGAKNSVCLTISTRGSIRDNQQRESSPVLVH